MATALFHLGMAEHILPCYEPLYVPQELSELCEQLVNNKDSRSKPLDTANIATPPVRKLLGSLYGYVDGSDLDVPVSVHIEQSVTHPTTPVRKGHAGTLLNDKNSIGQVNTSHTSNSGKLLSNARSNVIDDEDDGTLTAVPFTRSISFDSSIRHDDNIDISKLSAGT